MTCTPCELTTVTLFDFDACGLGRHAYDFASFRANTLDNEAAWHAFLDGYRTQCVLVDGDHAAIH